MRISFTSGMIFFAWFMRAVAIRRGVTTLASNVSVASSFVMVIFSALTNCDQKFHFKVASAN